MKKFIPLIFIIMFSFSMFLSLNTNALAQETGYGRVLKDNVYIYRNPEMLESDIIFTLTVSYYVYILDINATGSCYMVEYQETQNIPNGYIKIIGYVDKQSVTLWNSPSAPLFPAISAKLIKSSYVYELADNTSKRLVSAIINQNIKCYGSLYNEAEDRYYLYTHFGEEYGYVSAEVLDVTLPITHSDPMPTPIPSITPAPSAAIKPESSANGIFGDTDKDNSLQILLIAAICVPAVVIVYLMFKPSKKSRRFKKYYDEDTDDK